MSRELTMDDLIALKVDGTGRGEVLYVRKPAPDEEVCAYREPNGAIRLMRGPHLKAEIIDGGNA